MRIFWIFLVLISCDSPITPKQSAFFAPEFGTSSHNSFTTECNYSFSKNKIAKIFFSSINIKNNFPQIIKVFDERIIENSANVIEVKVSEYTDDQILVYSRMFTYVGNAPSNVQFYLTDSTSNFLAGSLFFNSEPNYDSLLPYINYIKADVRKLIENFEWNK